MRRDWAARRRGRICRRSSRVAAECRGGYCSSHNKCVSLGNRKTGLPFAVIPSRPFIPTLSASVFSLHPPAGGWVVGYRRLPLPPSALDARVDLGRVRLGLGDDQAHRLHDLCRVRVRVRVRVSYPNPNPNPNDQTHRLHDLWGAGVGVGVRVSAQLGFSLE